MTGKWGLYLALIFLMGAGVDGIAAQDAIQTPPQAQPQATDPATAPGYASRAATRAFSEDWYGAIDDYMAALKINPSFGDAMVGLAKCYYQLGEYDQALSYATQAEPYRRGDRSLVDLEGFIRAGLGDLSTARARFESVLGSSPNDLDARFGLALLDLAEGKKTEARLRFEDSLRIAPLDARSLASLALVSLDQGRPEDASVLVEKALAAHSDDARVQLVAAKVDAARGLTAKAIFHARNAVGLRPGQGGYRALLGSLLYSTGDFKGCEAVMRDAIAVDRKDELAWFALGESQVAQGEVSDAIYSLDTATGLSPDDEVARIALEEIVMDSSPLEGGQRKRYADWHVAKGRELEDRSYFDQAIVEYRRALKIDPYSVQGRTLYADLLRKRGYPARQLSELRFLEGIGKADRSALDTIEIYTSLLSGTVAGDWNVDQFALQKRPYSVAIFWEPDLSSEYHLDVSSIFRRYLTDLLGSSSRLSVPKLAEKVSSPGEAFRLAREAGADYYLLLSIKESDREIQVGGELRVGRTGSLATTFRSYRTGNDRVKNTALRLADSLVAALQPKGSILRRSQDSVLVDLGSADGFKVGDNLLVFKKGTLGVMSEGLGPYWPAQAQVGTLTLTKIDEEVATGTLKSSGFFDTINVGDEVIAAPASKSQAAGGQTGSAGGPSASSAGTNTSDFPGLFLSIRQLQ
ncbi:MAG TPA: tetratricopeptide repeat protein [Rectinemataceae bacterium]|nr:tetratricopeptide repeat protein [Rectinemataceae bacterium]